MTETTFAQRWAGESQRLPYWEAGAGETIVAILDGQRLPTRAHALLAERRRVIVFAMTADAGSPQGEHDKSAPRWRRWGSSALT